MNFLYTVYMGVTGFHWLNLLYFMGITFLVGLFPVTAVVVLKEFRLMKRNMAQAAMLTQALKDQHEIGIKPADQQAPLPTTISLRNETGAESLSLSANTLLFIAAADNYIEVCFEENGQAKKTLLRSSLKRAEEDLADFPGIMRCHRGYLVNTERIVSVSGNAQGLRLSLPPFPETIPVSRNYVARLRDLSGK